MSYTVKEIFYTLQGEGMNTGRPAVFCRFTGCNLWSGREQDRATAICQFCDTDFVGMDGPGGGRFDTAERLAQAIADLWPETSSSPSLSSSPASARPFVVCTGGEPLLQLDAALVTALHEHGFEIAIETNGTQVPPPGIDWLCVSPKAGAELVLRAGHELKLIYPQPVAMPEQFEGLAFQNFLLQPMDGPQREQNTQLAVQYCRDHPRWRLSLQTHKFLGIP